MDIAHPISSTVSSVSFSFLTTQDIRRISVKQITNPVLLDNLNQPNPGGLYDPALGPTTHRDICATCRLGYFACPGHFGHIELPSPVYHPLFMTTVYKLLRATCLFCHNFKVTRIEVCKAAAKLKLLERGLLNAANLVEDISFDDQKGQGKEDATKKTAKTSEKTLDQYVQMHLGMASSARRGDYKDGPVYQARKQVIDEFIKIASSNSKRCSHPECGANAHSFRKEGYTKIIEYDLSSKQKLQHAATGLRRPDILAMDRVLSQPGVKRPGQTNAATMAHDDSEMEVDAVLDTDSEEEEEGGLGGLAASATQGEEAIVAEPARAANGRVKGARGRNERLLAPEEVRAHLRRLFRNEATICSLIYGRQGPYAPINRDGLSPASADVFFIELMVVPPTRFRPPMKMQEQLFEHPQNELLTKILNTTYRVRDVNESLRLAKVKDIENLSTSADATRLLGQLLELMVTLQNDVNSFIDSSKSTTPVRQGKLATPGVKQGLEKKEGLFRMHMMGKRVNYAARSVISPDVNIETNEIGVPPVFARKLTFPEPVTPHNVTEMRALVIRGSREYPGASMVQFEDGSTQTLDKLSREQRTAIANQLLTPREGGKESTLNGLRTTVPFAGKKVFRHLQDGDILLLNRQPTLHKPSMMAHKARVLQGENTIRMHYANCNSYNADFDGDEMNIHFPQSQVARSEAMFIANTDNQYLVPTSGKPLRGLIQDHVVAGLWMTNKATFFTREEYQQLIYGALRPEDDLSGGGRVLTVPPAIWKPQPLWTGKQIISTILKNITPDNAAGLTLKSSSQIKNASWNRGSYPSEKATEQGRTNAKSEEERVRLAKGLSDGKVLFVAGDFVRGVLDKSQFGAASYGLVHAVYEIYGAETAGRLLGILSRLFTKYLQHRAFTCRMDDLALTPAGEKARKKVLHSGRFYGTQATESIFADFDPSSMTKTEREEELKKRLEKVYRDDGEMAGLDNAVKGKMKELFQKVVDVTLPKGLLRSFPDNHMQAMTNSGAKGSATNARQISVLLGQQELEGRRVPMMVSGKSLPSFKPYETAAIAGGYISSRFLTGLKPQEFYFHCMAGREGLIDTAVKTSRSGYLQRCLIKHLEGIRVHYDYTVRGADSSVYQFLYGEDGLDVTKQAHLNQFAFIIKNHRSIVAKYRPKDISGRINEDDAIKHMKRTLKRKKKHPDGPLPPTTLELYNPVTHLGATPEKFAEKVDAYIKENKNHLLKVKSGANMRNNVPTVLKERQFRALMQVKYLRSLADPGEAVGLLASQGVGEPSTQMTLNTFHFAGHGAANVTLGIPRLREIIMTASMKPKTPMMNLPIRKGTPAEDIKVFCQKASRLKLSYLVDKITVVERITEVVNSRHKVFSITIQFFPREEYMEEHFLTTSQLLEALGTKFAPALKKVIATEFHKLDADTKAQLVTVGKGKAIRNRPGGQEGDDELEDRDGDEESELGDGDADADIQRNKRKEHATYEDDDGDAEEVNSDTGADDIIADEGALGARSDDSTSESDGDDAFLEDDEQDNWKAIVQETQEAFQAALPLGARSFSFDNKKGLRFDLEYNLHLPKLLLIGILERVCLNTVVREVAGVSKCHFPREGTDAYRKVVKDGIVVNDADIVAEGSNLRGMAQFSESIVDISRLKTNDIGAVLKTYGVEAARATILQEISSVFAAYAINVNTRHLMLIADYMTFDGGYKPFNRAGIATHSSPLLKASYETTATFISDATLYGDFDNLTTPSGNIVLGRPSQSGTGIFDLVMPLSTSK